MNLEVQVEMNKSNKKKKKKKTKQIDAIVYCSCYEKSSVESGAK